MSHYDLTLWVDYVRGLISAEESARMGNHLHSCTNCAYLADLLRKASETARADRAFQPPPEVAAAAEAIFPAAASRVTSDTPELGFAGLRILRAELWSDSLSGAVPAGVRSLRSDPRHLAYRAGRYSVDLRLGRDPFASLVTLTGQIADATEPDTPMPDIEAIVMTGNRIVATATTTEFGEFFLHCEPGPNVRIVMPIGRSGECIEVPLNFPKDND